MRSTETFTEKARREQIAACAIEAIAELGYGQASVRKIADRAGVAMSVVLYHFGDKDSLIEAVVSECYRTLLAAMRPSVDAAPTAAGKLEAHIRAHLRYVQTHRAHQIALMEIANGFRSKDGKPLAEIPVDPEHAESLAAAGLEPILASGIESGEFRPLSPEFVATAIRGAIGSAMLAVTADGAFDLDGYADALVDMATRSTAKEH